MKRRTYIIIGIIAVLALTTAIGMFVRGQRVRAQQPDGRDEEPLIPAALLGKTCSASEPASLSDPEQVAALPAGTAYLVLPPSAFTWTGYGDPDYRMNEISGYLTGIGDDMTTLAASVHLPSGVTVVSLEVFVVDECWFGAAEFDLYRLPLEDGFPEEMAHVSTSQEPHVSTSPELEERGYYVSTDIANAEVSYDYAYQLYTNVNQDLRVYGARIGYVSTDFLPAVMR